jgi:hypothetical protein
MSVKMNESFGGEHSSEYNAMITALIECGKDWHVDHNVFMGTLPERRDCAREAIGDNAMYGWLEDTPKASLTVELVNKLHELEFLLISRKDLMLFTGKVNAVTAYHRHGKTIPARRLTDLANAQIDFEKEHGLL